MDGDSSCLRGSSDDVTGGGETTALNTKENHGGHLGGVRGYWRRGDDPKPICSFGIQCWHFLKKQYWLNKARLISVYTTLCSNKAATMQVSCEVHKEVHKISKQLQVVSNDHMRVSDTGKSNLKLCKTLRGTYIHYYSKHHCKQ